MALVIEIALVMCVWLIIFRRGSFLFSDQNRWTDFDTALVVKKRPPLGRHSNPGVGGEITICLLKTIILDMLELRRGQTIKSINHWSSWWQWTGMEIIACGWSVQFLVKSQRLSWLNIQHASVSIQFHLQHIHNFQDTRVLILFYKGNSKPLVSVYDFCSMTAT